MPSDLPANGGEYLEKDKSLYHANEFELYTDFNKGFESDDHSMHRTAQAGHFLSLIAKHFIREYNALDDDADDSDVKSLFSKYLSRFKREISNDWYKNDKSWAKSL